MLVEQFPYDCIEGDITFAEVSGLNRGFKRAVQKGIQASSEMDLSLAQLTLSNAPISSRALVINVGEGLAGIACLLSGSKHVVFVDSTVESICSVWKNVFLNTPEKMTKVQCYTIEESWDTFSAATVDTLRLTISI